MSETLSGTCCAVGCGKPAIDGVLCRECLNIVADSGKEPKPRMTRQRLESQVMTVGRLFKALDEVVERLHAPRTLPRSQAVIVCQELKNVLTEQITKEYEGE